MPFPESIRRWALSVTDGRCITSVYYEKTGYTICGRPAEEVDHSPPESVMIFEGRDPHNESTPIPRCKNCHTGSGVVSDENETYLAGFGEDGWAKHPEIFNALEEYRRGDKNAFKKAVQGHRDAVERGERFWNEDWQCDEFEVEIFNRMAHEKGIPRPEVKPHKSVRRKHWTDGWFGANYKDDVEED